MKKSELISLSEKYGGEILRNHITRMGVGIIVKTKEPIPEFDEIVEQREYNNVAGQRFCYSDEYEYRIFCPSDWIDLWGWK